MGGIVSGLFFYERSEYETAPLNPTACLGLLYGPFRIRLVAHLPDPQVSQAASLGSCRSFMVTAPLVTFSITRATGNEGQRFLLIISDA